LATIAACGAEGYLRHGRWHALKYSKARRSSWVNAVTVGVHPPQFPLRRRMTALRGILQRGQSKSPTSRPPGIVFFSAALVTVAGTERRESRFPERPAGTIKGEGSGGDHSGAVA